MWRETTLEVKLPRDVKVEPSRLFNFLEGRLGIKLDTDVYSIQQQYRRKLVSISFKERSRCAAVADMDDGSLTLDGHKVSLVYLGGSVSVRVLDLPWRMSHQVVERALSQYGEQLGKMSYEYWRINNKTSTVSNGTRVVRMKVTKPIPSYIQVGEYTAVILYEGQQATCVVCNGPHMVKDCTQKGQKKSKSFVSALKGPQGTPPSTPVAAEAETSWTRSHPPPPFPFLAQSTCRAAAAAWRRVV